MVNVFSCLPYLSWTQSPKEHPLPSHVHSTSVATPCGNLELLSCQPRRRDPKTPPLIFVHGGFGFAAVWLDWITYLYDRGYAGTIYAYSARSHGASYPVPYLQMVCGTVLDDFASDLATVVWHITTHLEDEKEPILIAHSAGGALVQYTLLNGMITATGLCLVGSVPHFGGLDAYWNWTKMDPWMHPRSWIFGFHPTSGLAHPKLVHRAFFSDIFSPNKVEEFMHWMAPYESLGWASGQNGSFWKWLMGKNEWLEPMRILKSLNGWERPGDRVCVMVGSHDRLMDLSMARRQVSELRAAVRAMDMEPPAGKHTHGFDADTKENDHEKATLEVEVEALDRVRLVVVQGAGHHTQNDIQWQAAAEAVRRWLEQL
jgi:pimeloyl-ACP methyl ester carboxylesterase